MGPFRFVQSTRPIYKRYYPQVSFPSSSSTIAISGQPSPTTRSKIDPGDSLVSISAPCWLPLGHSPRSVISAGICVFLQLCLSSPRNWKPRQVLSCLVSCRVLRAKPSAQGQFLERMETACDCSSIPPHYSHHDQPLLRFQTWFFLCPGPIRNSRRSAIHRNLGKPTWPK